MANEKLKYTISVEGGGEFKKKMKDTRATTQKESKLITGSLKDIGNSAKTFLAGAAVAALGRVGLALADMAEETRVVRRSFERLATGIGQNADAILKGMQKGIGGTVKELDLMKQANQAILLGIPVTAAQMEKMAQVALRLGRAVGRTGKDSMGDLITGIGRMSPLILDNLGITIKAEEAYRGLGEGR